MPPQQIRYDWTLEEIRTIFHQPLLDLVFQAASIHRHFHHPRQMQICHLISVKTGGCPEDCKYCSQSSRYSTPIQAQPLLEMENVMERAQKTLAKGVTRICLGAAWRQPRPGKQFDTVLKMIENITDLGVEVCCTLGMLHTEEAEKLSAAGAYAYNHNLDTSKNYYSKVVTTRSYEDRLQTLDTVEKTTMTVCCGGIIGLGESIEDRISLLHTLATRPKHPESVPINALFQVPGTPFENNPKVSAWEMLRMIATARILMPKSMVRLACGRIHLTLSEQALCFLAGANSIFLGEEMLTKAVPNPAPDEDEAMLKLFGLEKMPPFTNRRGAE